MELLKANLEPWRILREKDSDYYCDGPSPQFYRGLGLNSFLLMNNQAAILSNYENIKSLSNEEKYFLYVFIFLYFA